MRDDDESLDAVRTKGDQDPRCAHPELMSNAWTVREISPGWLVNPHLSHALVRVQAA